MRVLIMILVGFSVLWGEHFWSDFRSNCRQDGLSQLIGPRDPNFLWEITFKPTGNNESAPENKSIGFYTPMASGVIASDSTLFVHCNGGRYLLSIKNDQLQWRETFSGEYDRNICIDDEGILYFPYDNNSRYLCAFDPKLRIQKWRTGGAWDGESFSVTLGTDGIIYISDNTDKLQAFERTQGKLLWRYSQGDISTREIAFGLDSGLYFGRPTRSMLTVFYSDYTKKEINLPGVSLSTINKEGQVFVVSRDTMYSYSQGLKNVNWKTALDDTSTRFSPCSICPDGSIVAPSDDGYVHKVTKEGQYLWRSVKLDGYPLNWITLDAEGKIFVSGGSLHCLNPDGSLKYTISGGFSQSLICPGRRLYILTASTIICYNDKGSFTEEKSYSKPIPKAFKAEPNPFINYLAIESSSEISIYSITGQFIIKKPQGKYRLDTSIWQEGVYLIQSGREVKRVVKIK